MICWVLLPVSSLFPTRQLEHTMNTMISEPPPVPFTPEELTGQSMNGYFSWSQTPFTAIHSSW
jgi:hypothetical protein